MPGVSNTLRIAMDFRRLPTLLTTRWRRTGLNWRWVQMRYRTRADLQDQGYRVAWARGRLRRLKVRSCRRLRTMRKRKEGKDEECHHL